MPSAVSLAVAIATVLVAVHGADYTADEITDLPGLTFKPTFKQYSGFLTTSTGSNLFYWLVEHTSNPTNAPLVLWLNGGPGCSSLSGLFQENGPYQVSSNGENLIENVYSWNKLANVIYLEAPRGVGFSYRDPSLPANATHNDDWTAADNAEAIQQFIIRFPHYAKKQFYITGESYAGVYIPTLASRITDLIDANKLDLNFVGFAIGNGILNSYQQVNSFIDLSFYRGLINLDTFNQVKECCPTSDVNSLICDYATYYLDFIPATGEFNPKHKAGNPEFNRCATLIRKVGVYGLWGLQDPYNDIAACYETDSGIIAESSQLKEYRRIHKLRQTLSKFATTPIITDGIDRFVDQGAQINTQSADPWGSYECFSETVMINYLNRDDVKTALHLTDYAKKIHWVDCVDTGSYTQQNPDTTPVFLKLLSWSGNLRILLYNGDTDAVCNFLGDQWFADRLPLARVTNRTDWHFASTSDGVREVAGSQKRFSAVKSKAILDVVTVKGSGHMVPQDRPGPMFQLLANFLVNNSNYDTSSSATIQPQPVLPAFAPKQEALLTRKEADKVYSLPGLTFQTNFDNYAGYLNGVTGDYLHYWLVTSQTNPGSDPLFLWLTGGPGCSGLGALLTELGPFRPNSDNKTLSENPYAWNKFANVVFLESPRGVGFSYQDKNLNNDTIYDDDRSALDAYLALKDFFTVYPEYLNREFYIVGESYGGVYVPMLSALLIQKIQSGDIKNVNFVGFAIGNGELSGILGGNSLLSDMYYHGYIGKADWDQLAGCCNTSYQEAALCRFDERYYTDMYGNAIPVNASDQCDVIIANAINNVWTEELLVSTDVYNAYQDCYQQTSYLLGSLARRNKKLHKKVKQSSIDALKRRRQLATAFADSYQYTNDNYNPISTDALGGFPCFGTGAAAEWLNLPEVRRALHVPDWITQEWGFCNDEINENYDRQYNDTTKFFDQIIAANYPVKILIYNGDVDFACNFMGDQWFVEAVAERWGIPVVKPYNEWHYRNQIAGYVKTFAADNVQLNLATVKGAGHMVPMDRPGPALQLLANFFNNRDFSQAVVYNTDNTPLKPQYKALELLTNISITAQTTSTVQKAKALLGDALPKRTKREVKADPPPPPAGSKAADKITSLPGLTFDPKVNQYSGYLTASKGVYLHYWLIESENSATDPIILWLNGGPGCSSLGGLINELGPFRPSADGSSLYENPFAWTKAGNVLFLEGPRGVGFSYSSGADYPSDSPYNDTMTAANNVLALISFFDRYPEYKNRKFYITGESYGGVYIPTLTDALIKKIQSDKLTYINFAGIAIGNGELSEQLQVDSAINLLYYRGQYDLPTFKQISACCANQNSSGPDGYLTPCTFTDYITLDTAGNAHAIPSSDPLANACGKLVEDWGFNNVWGTLNDVYNTVQDCYNPPYTHTGLANKQQSRRVRRSADGAQAISKPAQTLANNYDFVDFAKRLNKDSTDAFSGVYCYQDDATLNYLHRADVREALHVNIPGLPAWTDCNDEINEQYHQEHNDTTAVFDSIIASGWNLSILIYNGDVDMACQFKGDEWFIERLGNNYDMIPTQRNPWYYKYVDGTDNDYDARVGGWYKTFKYGSQISIDLLTVRGGGHLVPLDRPAPSLQMIYNFINRLDYSTPLKPALITPKPLLQSYKPSPIPLTPHVWRSTSMVHELPGLTFDPAFGSHSGYLKAATEGNYLHYWFAESQNDPMSDPLVFWLSGAVGCSSVGSALLENGPFKVNPDGQTLFENVFSWNKQASIVFLETPAGTGFSFQDLGVNKKTAFDDDSVAADTTAAILDWLSVFANFAGRQLYIGGEAYGGVLVPLIANSLATKIGNKEISLNFAGILIGNGYLSNKWDVSTIADYMYFHAQYSRDDWNSIRACCANNDTIYCDITSNLKSDLSSDGSSCGNIAYSLTQERVKKTSLNTYNLYQDCYGYSSRADIQKNAVQNSEFTHGSRVSAKAAFVNQFLRYNFKSTDSNGGYQCYAADAITSYLRQQTVRDALHVPDYVPSFDYCRSSVKGNYTAKYNADLNTDMTPTFVSLLNSAYVKSATTNFRVLIYNGDTDLTASHLEAEYFVDEVVNALNLNVSADYALWKYTRPGANPNPYVGGYAQSWAGNNVVITRSTVKGAGAFVAADRPGPALQLFTNFVNGQAVNAPLQVSIARSSLKAAFAPVTAPPSFNPGSGLSRATTPGGSTGATAPGASTGATAPGATTTTVKPITMSTANGGSSGSTGQTAPTPNGGTSGSTGNSGNTPTTTFTSVIQTTTVGDQNKGGNASGIVPTVALLSAVLAYLCV
uniref:Carboxypeptidase n=1 Tax=Panagrellus redivivus TaxID=6233 RepID=A0A7E4VLI3_PANRE